MKKSLAVLALISLFLITPLHAETWTIDKAQSQLAFTGTQTGAKFTGYFTRYDAAIDFDPANPTAGHAVVTVDMASATTGDKQRDMMVQDADWFDTAQFPTARFEATSFRAIGNDAYQAIGTLTIRGVKKDVVLPFTMKIANGVATIDGAMPLRRGDYGVGQGAWSTGQWVGLDVSVTLHVMATAAK